MRTIQTCDDLLAEKKELEAQLAIQRGMIRHDWHELKEELRPVTAVLGFLGKLTTKSKTNTLISLGVDIASDVLLKKFLFAKVGWLGRLAVPFFVKNYSTHILGRQNGNGHDGNFFHRLAAKWKKT